MKRNLRRLERYNPFEDRTPVQRRRAALYLMITLLSFAVSVSATRLFLEITGYPRLGVGEIHIAHVLWGGLLLFLGALLPLILANEWALRLSAVFSGVGIGLFIDEVGKFITQTNDYFHPAAAPIVYVFFLLTVLLFAYIRHNRKTSARSEMYTILEQFHEVLDHDLSTEEYQEILERLDEIMAANESKPLVDLAQHLKNYLDENHSRLVPDNPILIDRVRASLRQFEQRVLNRKNHKLVVTAGLLLWGGWTLLSAIRYLLIFRDTPRLAEFIEQLIESRMAGSTGNLTWFEVRVLMEGGIGILALLAALFFLINAERKGLFLGIITLLVSLSIVTPLVFYYEQFSTAIAAAIQFILLILLLRYRRRHFT